MTLRLAKRSGLLPLSLGAVGLVAAWCCSPFRAARTPSPGITLLIAGLATAADLFSVFVGPPKTPLKRAAPAEAASVDSALPAAPADAALAIEEGQGASSPTPMSGGGSGGEALSVGEAQLGKPFVLKTDGPNTFSCVGLMCYILRTISTDSDAPWVPEEYLSRYPAVDRANLQPEDIVIYPGWATMYAGNGQLLNSNEMEGVVTHTPMDVAGEPLGIVRPY